MAALALVGPFVVPCPLCLSYCPGGGNWLVRFARRRGWFVVSFVLCPACPPGTLPGAGLVGSLRRQNSSEEGGLSVPPGRWSFVRLRSRGGVSSPASRVLRGPGWPGPLPLPLLSPWLRCAWPLWLPAGRLWRGPVSPWLRFPLLGSGPRLPLPLSRLPGPLPVWRPWLPARLPVLRLPLPSGRPVFRRGLPPWLRPLLPVWLPSPRWRLPPPVSLPVLPVSGLRSLPAPPVCASRSWVSSPFALVFSSLLLYTGFRCLSSLRPLFFLGLRGFWCLYFALRAAQAPAAGELFIL